MSIFTKYIITFSQFLFIFSHWMIQAFLPIYLKEIGFSDSFIGLLIGVFSASYLLLVFPAGFLSDRLRIVNLIRIGIILFLLYIVGLIYAKSPFLFIIFTIIGGVGAALVTVSLTTIFYKKFSSESRGRNIGIFSFGIALGYSLGPLSAGLLLPRFGMEGVLIASFCSILSLLMLSFGIKTDKTSPATYAPLLIRRIKYHTAVRRWDIMILFYSIIVFSCHLGMEQSTFTLFMEKNLSLSLPSIGSIYACIGIWIGLNSFILGRLFDRTQNILSFIIFGMLCSGFFQIITVLAQGYWVFLFIRLIHTIGDASIIMINGVMTSLFFKQEIMGEGVGAVFGLRMATISVSAALCGFLNEIYGYRINFFTTGILSIALGIFIIINRARIKDVLNRIHSPSP